MLLHSAAQLLTIAGSPQRGVTLGNLGIIPEGAVLIRDGMIEAVGTTSELRQTYPQEEKLDAAGHVVMPGFVDPHTHLMWVGDRAAEFEMRLQGKTYLEILADRSCWHYIRAAPGLPTGREPGRCRSRGHAGFCRPAYPPDVGW